MLRNVVTRLAGQSARITVLALLVGVLAGSGALPRLVSQVNAQITVPTPVIFVVNVETVGANDAVITNADPSGFSIGVSCAGATGAGTTTAGGATFPVVIPPPGGNVTCTAVLAARAGFTFVSLTSPGRTVETIPGGGRFAIQVPGANPIALTIRVRSTAAPTPVTFNVNVETVGANDAVIPTADKSGFSIGVSCAGVTGSGTTAATGAAITVTPAPAANVNCTFVLAARAGFTFVSLTSPGRTVEATADGGRFDVPLPPPGPITVTIRVRTSPGAGPAGPTTTEQLARGCNLVVLTWPVATELRVVVEATSGDLAAIWTLDNATSTFRGFSTTPGAEVANNFRAVERSLQPVFLCMRTAGTVVRPNP